MLSEENINKTFRAVEKSLSGIHVRTNRAEGWALKESHDLINKKWEERYFIIDGPKKKVTYYEVPASGELVKKGEYQLGPKSPVKKTKTSNKPFCVSVEGKHNYNMTSNLIISVNKDEIADEWVKILSKVIRGEPLSVMDEAEACCALCTIA